MPKRIKNLSDEWKKNISKSHLGKHIGNKNSMWGKHHSEETKLKISLSELGKIISDKSRRKMSEYRKGKKLSKETKRRMSKASKGKKKKPFSEIHKYKIKLNRAKQICPIKDTSIEIKIQNFLKQLGITFFTHQYMKIEHGYQCDILIPSMNLVIECDGDYWHKYPIGNDIDHVRTKELIEKGFKVLRLWEREIKIMELNDFKIKMFK